ncbi:hypothetical protein [Lacihabitans soyangensis]|uniref:Uncharacterized protein n=1 Tax=Lacihabitans soyangensis TaxID=869394 RepID=A0AAE3KRD0_9BACT|nr:hypothetical protein [Lacihabitans soyangensis]MCP9761334.1 hypothetical protein [Lacihabitans soyangensis]
MKSLILVLLFPFLIFSKTDKDVFGGHKLTIQEAERILGETCQLIESGNETKVGGHKYKSTHIGSSNANHALYFIFESYESELSANKTFDEFKMSNQTSSGFEKIEDIGDEAFFHTDKENFGLVIARKGNEIVRLKVNKLSSRTSISELKKVASEIIART